MTHALILAAALLISPRDSDRVTRPYWCPQVNGGPVESVIEPIAIDRSGPDPYVAAVDSDGLIVEEPAALASAERAP
jgi:hypothetical protein